MSNLKRFVISYSLGYQHVVHVGIEAKYQDEALAKAQDAMDAGILWDDMPDMPLLMDEFEEECDNALEFQVEYELLASDPWPEPDASVKGLQLKEQSIALVRLIASMDKDGEEVDGVEWDMPSDDAIDTLHRLISDAREIIA